MPIADVFDRFPELATPRFRLRQPRLDDAPALFAVMSDPAVMQYYGMLPLRSVAAAADLVRFQRERYAERKAIRWVIARHADDVALGSCGFHHFGEGYHRAELGYELHRAFWRQGIMSEALAAVLAFAFDSMALHRVEAVVDDDNAASKALLLKLGFAFEGCLKERFFFNGRFWDEYYFGLVQSDYRRQHASRPGSARPAH